MDISGSEVEIKVERLEDDIFAIRNTEDYQNLDKLDSVFILDFKRGIMGTETRDGFVSADESAEGLIKFVTFPDMIHLYKTVDSIYPDLDFLNTELSEAFSYYHYYFPEKLIPKVYTVVTPFRSQVISSQHALGICLDMYLWENNSHLIKRQICNFPISLSSVSVKNSWYQMLLEVGLKPNSLTNRKVSVCSMQ